MAISLPKLISILRTFNQRDWRYFVELDVILFNIFGGKRDLLLFIFFSHIQSTEVAHEEKANGGEVELHESDQDEDGVAAAQVEPVAAEQAKEDAAIISIFFEEQDFLEPDRSSGLLRLANDCTESFLRVNIGRMADAKDQTRVVQICNIVIL